jgi:AraC-like DNA-binding protein
MPVLPVPMIISLVLTGFLIARLTKGGTHISLLSLIAVCASQAALIALVQYYQITVLRPLQPVLATVIPSVAWYAFERASGNRAANRYAYAHLLGPVFALTLLFLKPELLDILIPAIFLGYGIAMLVRLGEGEDSLQHARLESGNASVIAWRIVALALIASAACDVLIAYSIARGTFGNIMWIPSLVSTVSLLGLGMVGLSSAIESRREPDIDTDGPTPDEIERDNNILQRLEDQLQRNKLYLDPDLTLARLAKRLQLPAKQVSAAINRGKKENVSRFINRLRIEEACQLLECGKPVTTVMYDAGFNTKSNFNREFLRVVGKSPSNWLTAKKRGAAT